MRCYTPNRKQKAAFRRPLEVFAVKKREETPEKLI